MMRVEQVTTKAVYDIVAQWHSWQVWTIWKQQRN